MLGLRPRLKARNSLWELVNKHHPDLHSPSPLSWKQPVEEGADGLPPLPFSPPSPQIASPEQKTHCSGSSESFAAPTMAPVSSPAPIALCDPADEANGSQRKTRRDRRRKPAKSNMVRLRWNQMLGTQEMDIADCRLAQALSSPSLGMWLQEKARKIRSDIYNQACYCRGKHDWMCYVRVGTSIPNVEDELNQSYVPTRSVSVTTAWSERSFVSKPIKQPSRCMRKPVST